MEQNLCGESITSLHEIVNLPPLFTDNAIIFGVDIKLNTSRVFKSAVDFSLLLHV